MSRRILVIEDEENFRDTLQEILGDAGYEVNISPYLATAIATALSGSYDLIILDLRMPGMDGQEIAGLFRRQDLHTPVLVISGYLTSTIANRLKALGIRYVLSKPVDVPRLIKTVERALA